MYETLNAPELQDDFAASGPDTSSVSDYETGGEYAGYEEASDPGIDNLGFSAGVANSGHGGRSGETAAADNDPGEYDAGLRADEGWEDVPFHNHPRWKELIAQKQAMARELAGLAGFAPVIQRRALTAPKRWRRHWRPRSRSCSRRSWHSR